MDIHDQTRSPVELLPVEIWQSILLFLPDPRSLASTALSCRTAYSAFVEDKRRVIRQVLANHIGIDVLLEALLVLKCKPAVLSTLMKPKPSEEQSKELYRFPRPARLDAVLFGAVGLENRPCPLRISFTYVELGKSLNTSPPSTADRARIAQAFYSFELFRKLVGCQGILNTAVSACEFFSKFAPWENAQLACVHDFLAWEVIPVFDEVSKHDVVWGEHRVPFANSPASTHIQHVLSLGLEKLYQVITARSWKDKKNALCVKEMPPGINLCFLHDPMENFARRSRCHRLGRRRRCRGSAGDEGPTTLSALAYYEEEHWIHRRWGYVMWDEARLQALRVLEKPLPQLEEREPGTEMAPIEDMQKSWDARASIYERGGRGWWEENDETRLSWPKPIEESTGPGPSVQKVPTSLAEAKDLWRSSYDELKTSGP